MEGGASLEFEKHMESVRTFARTGNIQMALQMLDVLEKAYPGREETLIRLRGELLLTDDRKKELRDKFFSDRKALSGYDLVYGSIPEETDWYVISCDEQQILAINEKTGGTRKIRHGNMAFENAGLKGNAVYVEGAFFQKQIKSLADQVEPDVDHHGLRFPIYLIYTPEDIEVLLQVADIPDIVSRDCFVFVIGNEGVEKCFSDLFIQVPQFLFSLSSTELVFEDKINEVVQKRTGELEEKVRQLDEYYGSDDNGLEGRIREKRPRILFWTSRFTATLQYHVRDSMDAAKRAGCECYYLIEPASAKRITREKQVDVLLSFKPDVIFDVDHMRFENDYTIYPRIIYVTWIQDPLPVLIDPATRDRLQKRDILLNHLINEKEVVDIYGDILVDAPTPANSHIYKPYELTEKEKEEYGADICFVCHASDVEAYIDKVLSEYGQMTDDEVILGIIRDIFSNYRKEAQKGNFFFSRKEFADFIVEQFRLKGYELGAENVDALADEMEKWYNQRLFRQILVDWMIEAGVTSIKLWGNGWKSSPKYTKFAMGPAQNGEVLSKIYQASKVVMGNNIRTTGAARAWESMLSGAFYLSNYIPEENDICDIRKMIPEGSFEMFRSKEELIDKLSFYLENDEERQKMAEKGRKAALETMTFDALMDKLLRIMPEYL